MCHRFRCPREECRVNTVCVHGALVCPVPPVPLVVYLVSCGRTMLVMLMHTIVVGVGFES